IAELLPLELGEAAPEPLDEDGAIAESGQRIAELRRAQLLLCGRLGGRVGERSRDPHRPLASAARRHAAAQNPSIGPGLVTDAMLVLERTGLAGKMRVERVPEGGDIVGVAPLEPFLRVADAARRRQPEHRLPAPGDVERLRAQIDLPQAVVRALGREREALFAPLAR